MGQLEKYGLYVLCLVIFLILGVAIWGDPEPVLADRSGMAAVVPAAGPAAPAENVDFDALMRPAPKPGTGASGIDDGSLPVDPGGGRQRGESKAGPEPKAGLEPKAGPEPAGKTGPVPQFELAVRPTRTIRAGDRFEDIAVELGDRRYVALLRELNPKVQPERLRPGKELTMPTAADLQSFRDKNDKNAKGDKSDKSDKKNDDRKPATEPAVPVPPADQAPAAHGGARTHRIEQGDTIEGLAVRLFGKAESAKRVKEIKQLNPTVDPTRLRIGQLILLPAN